MAAAEKECDGGAAASCGDAGLVLVDDNKYEAVAAFFARGCEAGHPPGCAQLATAYLLGRGVARDPARARQLYKKACAASDRSACEALKLTR